MPSNGLSDGHTSPTQEDYHTTLDKQGFVIIPSLLTPTQLTSLRAASTHATALARAGKWPHIRTLPKQFPPWPSSPSSGIWGVQHLLHPAMPSQATFSASYFSPAVRDIATALLDCREEDLVMELYNLLVRPDTDFELRWHRDDVSAEASEEEERRRLCADEGRKRIYSHAQWNVALWEDESLVVVPGSHRRVRTVAERGAGAYEGWLEGMLVVELGPGDAVFYDNNILHRGVYRADTERMTLHGSVGRVGRGEDRARNVLQHGVGGWIGECDFSGLEEVEGGMGVRAEGMRMRLVEMGRGRKVEYSQPD